MGLVRILGLGRFMLRLVVTHFELFTNYFCVEGTAKHCLFLKFYF